MELLTLTEAAAAAGVSDRTLRKWDRKGRVTRIEGTDGRPRYRRAEVEALRAAGNIPPGYSEPFRNGSEAGSDRVGSAVGSGRKETFRTPDMGPLNGARHETTPAACECCKVRADETEFLRQQLEARTAAEAELRRLLLAAQQLAAQLGEQVAQRALPPAPENLTLTNPRRVRWWHLWRR